MAVISADTFDPLRRFISVRLQQGVPLVDADVNELDDIRKFEMRAFLRWFVGDGVPEGSDGFRIVATGLANDVTISSGVPAPPPGLDNLTSGLRFVGRCLVDGRDAVIRADVNLRAQALHASQPGSAALAARWSVPTIPELPATDGTVLLFIDVWDRLVTPDEEPSLIFPGLGTESAARLRREWVVRWTGNPAPPSFGDAAYLSGHGYYAIARVARRAADPLIFPADVTDLRERRLLTPPATLIEDILGGSLFDYRRGIGRPPISVREAVNALLRGELPSTPDRAIAPGPGLNVIRRGLLLDVTNGIVAVWQSDRVGGINQAFDARLDMGNVAAGFGAPPEQVTSGAEHGEPHAAALPNGDLIVAYSAGSGATSDIFMKRAQFGALAAAPEVSVAGTPAEAERTPFVVVTGVIATVFYHRGSTNRWQSRRRRHTDDTWLDPGGMDLSTQVTTVRTFHAARDGNGRIWAAFRAGNDIRALRFDPVAGTGSNEATHDSTAGVDDEPYVLPTAGGDVWVFWYSPAGLHSVRFHAGGWEAVQAVANTLPNDRQPCAVEAADGGIWLLWTRGNLGSGDIFLMRRNPDTGNWGQPRQVTISASDDSGPFAVVSANNAIWLVWSSDRDGNANPYFKRLVTTI